MSRAAQECHLQTSSSVHTQQPTKSPTHPVACRGVCVRLPLFAQLYLAVKDQPQRRRRMVVARPAATRKNRCRFGGCLFFFGIGSARNTRKYQPLPALATASSICAPFRFDGGCRCFRSPFSYPQLGFQVTPSPHTQHRTPQPVKPSALGATASPASLSEMLRASWTPVKLPCFGSASDFCMESPRAPVAGGGAGVGLPGLLGREVRYGIIRDRQSQ